MEEVSLDNHYFGYRFLVEYMFMNGKAMMYPNLPEQASFSTHHREPGEHTDVISQIPLVDDLTLDKNPFFTVPMALNASLLEFFTNRFHLRSLPVVNFYHEKVKGLYSLRQVGLHLLDSFASNYKNKQKESLPLCILDYIAPNDEYQKRQWDLHITFEPADGILEQIEQLNAIFEIGKALNRRVILPKAKLVSGREISFNSIVKITRAYTESPANSRVRSVLAQKIDETGVIQKASREQDFFPLIGLTDKEIIGWFGGCNHDYLLKIDRPDLLFSQTSELRWPIDNEIYLPEYQDWIKDIAFEIGTKVWKGNYLCIDVTRPSQKVCGELSHRFGSNNSFFEANCVISPLTALSNLFNDTKARSKPFIYAISNSEDWKSVAFTYNGNDKVGKIPLPLIRRTFITEQINFRNSWADSEELAKLVEVELCTNAKEFIGSSYSFSSSEILKRREVGGKKSRIIGR